MNLEILTPTGFQKFDGVKRYWHNEYLKISFDDATQVECALDHRFMINESEIFAHDLFIGQNIGKIISNIEIIKDGAYFYDPINVANGEVYTHDDVFTSHNTFYGTGDTLIDPATLMGLRAIDPQHITNEDVKVYKEPVEGHQYVMTVDVGKGRGKDYSTFTIIDISTDVWEQVATYRNNKISPILFPNVIEKIAKVFNNAIVVVENNDSGELVCYGLYYELEYENLYVESAVKSNRLGVTMTRKSKRIGGSGMKDLIEGHKIILHDKETIKELATFVHRGTSYEASSGNHDDMVMNLVLFSYFSHTSFFADMSDINLRKLLFDENMREIDEDVLPFGFIDDGSDYMEEIDRPTLAIEFEYPYPI